MPLNRSFLFAPGNVARRVEKALTLEADAVILDLEDSVAVSDKPATRKSVVQALSRPQSCLPLSVHEVSAIGPSTASTISARLIAAAGRASWSPPPTPRELRSSPAAVSRLTTFCTVGTGKPVSSASCAADTRRRFFPSAPTSCAEPQWRAAALIVTTA